MCFSVGASFLSGAFLLGIGLATINQASKRYLLIATVPILFAIQQFCEGVLWIIFIREREALSLLPLKLPFWLLSFPKAILDAKVQAVPFYLILKKWVITLFLFFAFIIWPIWIPLSFYVIETQAKRKKLLLGLLIVGLSLALYLLYAIFLLGTPQASVTKHIVYRLPSFSETSSRIGLAIYCLATLFPFFISSIISARFIGILLVASVVISYYVWHVAFVSVWCFCSALISSGIFLMLPRKKSHS